MRVLNRKPLVNIGVTHAQVFGIRNWYQKLAFCLVQVSSACVNPTSAVDFYRPDALPITQPTSSKHWRHVSSDFIYHQRCDQEHVAQGQSKTKTTTCRTKTKTAM